MTSIPAIPLFGRRLPFAVLLISLIFLPGLRQVWAEGADSVVVINEIQYNPTSGGSEWVELKNMMGVDVDLSGWHFSDGFEYTFPEGTVIPGRGFLIVAETPGGVTAAPGVSVLGPFASGGLSNGGEDLELSNRNGRVMDVVSYEDEGRWPLGADGSGATLATVPDTRVATEPSDWRASTEVGGTPGAENFPGGVSSPGVIINEMSAGGGASFQLEIKNAGNTPVAVGGYVLRNADLPMDYPIPAESLDPGEFLVLTEEDIGHTPIAGDKFFLFDDSGTSLLDAARVENRALARTGADSGFRWAYPDSATFDAVNSFSFNEDIVINEIHYHAQPTLPEPGTPAEVSEVKLVEYGDSWLYNESGDDPGNDWAATTYSTGGDWANGGSPLGYEPDTPPVSIATALTNPSTHSPYVITYYFQHEFSLTSAQLDELTELRLTHLFDDGAVVYLNGQEVLRHEMPTGTITASTTATTGADASEIKGVVIDSSALVAGTNRISVSVHQVSNTSSDILFGLELEADIASEAGIPGSPFAKNPEEWVELYNRGSSTIDLSGWAFTDGIDFTFPVGTSLASGAHLVVAWDSAAMAVLHPSANIAGTFDGTLSNGGERLALTDANGNLADEVRWYDGGRWPKAADGKGSSLELIDPSADNNHPGAWRASDESDRGEWMEFTWRGVPGNGLHGPGINAWQEFVFGLNDDGTFLIDDISVVEDPDGSPLELIPNGNFDAGNADGWRIIGNHRHYEITDDPESPGNDVLRIRSTGSTGHVHDHVSTTLKNGGSIHSIDPNETYEISFRARWVSGRRSLNARLYHNRLARSVVLPVNGTAGSPGETNPGSLANIGPLFTEPAHSPVVPSAGETVEVAIRPRDPDGISDLTLHYSFDGGVWQDTAMTQGADGLWTGQIPGAGRTSGDQAQFYIEGEDSLGATATWPSSGEDSRALVRWDDGLALLQVNGVEPTNFRILMDDADAEWMHESGNAMSNDMLGTTVIINEADVYYDVGVRIKGSPRGRTVPDRVGYSLRFPTDEPFMGIHERISVDRSGPDESTSVREILFKHAVNHAAGGVPSTYDDVIRVIAPNRIGNEDSGVYFPNVATEAAPALLNRSRYDDELLGNQWEDGDDGEVFEYELIYRPAQTVDGNPESLKLPRRGATGSIYRQDFESIFGSTDKELYRWHWLIKNNRAEDRFDHLIEFVSTMGDRSNPDFHDDLRQLMDMDQWLRAVAFHILFGVSDSYTGSSFSVGLGHNMAIYFRPEDGKALFLPWDSDFAFKLSATLPVSNHGQLGDDLDALIQDPGNKRLYYGHLLDIIATTFNTAYLGSWSSHYTDFSGGENLTQFDSYVATRASHVEGLIASDIPSVSFAITTPDGTSTEDAVVAITGNGWLDIRELRLNGSDVPLEVTWTDETTWRALVPISAGSQTLTIEAYNYQGTLLADDSINITGTAPVEAAGPGNLVISEFHYHPADPSSDEIAAGHDDKDDFEFIELLNTGSKTINLAGVSFTDGIEYAFGSGDVLLDPGQRILLVEDAAAFEYRYGSTAAAGIHAEWSGGLSNGGEQLLLESASSGIIADFTYDDSSPWPANADGDGASLVLIDPFDVPDPSIAANWRASLVDGGKPAEDDSQTYDEFIAQAGFSESELADPSVSGPEANADGDSFSNIVEYALGSDLRDAGSTPAIQVVLVQTGGENYLEISYTVPADRNDIAVDPLFSDDLISWHGPDDAGGPWFHQQGASPVENPDRSETYTWQTARAGSPLFLRLEIRELP